MVEKSGKIDCDVLARIEAGEAAVAVTKARALRHIHRATVIRWIHQGRLPAARFGSRWYTTDSLVREALTPKPKQDRNEAHEKAMGELKAARVIK